MKSLGQPQGRRVTPGDLTALVVFEAETRTDDAHGGATQSWGEAFRAYASIEPLFVGEREHLGAIRNVVQYRFTIYRTSAIDEQMRIRFDGRTHNIKGLRLGGPQELFMDVITETGLGD